MSFLDVNTKEYFPVSVLDSLGRPLPEHFGLVRYHSWGPIETPVPPAAAPVPNALHGIPKDDVLGKYAKTDSRIANGLYTIRQSLQRLSYPTGFSRNDGMSVERALELKFRQVYQKDYAEELDPYMWQVYTWTTSEILSRLVFLKLQVEDLFGTPAVAKPAAGVPKQNDVGDPYYYSGVDRVTPNLVRPINTRDTWTQATSNEYDPLHNYGIRRLVAEGKGCVGYRYSCCYQSMGSEGCILGYPEKTRGSVPQLYTWYAGNYPSLQDAEYRGVVFALSGKSEETYTELHNKIKAVLTEKTVLQRLERGEFSDIASDPVMFRKIQEVIYFMNEYNAPLQHFEEVPMTPAEMIEYLRGHVKVRAKVQQQKFEEKRQRVALDWKTVFLKSPTRDTLEYNLESIRSSFPGPYESLIKWHYLVTDYLTGERRIAFVQYVNGLPPDLQRFNVADFEQNAYKYDQEELRYRQRYYLLFKEEEVDEKELQKLLNSEPLNGVDSVLQLLLEAKKSKAIIDSTTMETLKTVSEIPKLKAHAQQLQMTGKLIHIRPEVKAFRKLYTQQTIDMDEINLQWRKILGLIKTENVKKLDGFLLFVKENKIEQNLLGVGFLEKDANTLRGNVLTPFFNYLSDALQDKQSPSIDMLQNALKELEKLQEKKKVQIEENLLLARKLKELDTVDKPTNLRNFLYYGKALDIFKFNYLIPKDTVQNLTGLNKKERQIFDKFASLIYYVDKRYTAKTPSQDANLYVEVPEDDFYSELFYEDAKVSSASFSADTFSAINQNKTIAQIGWRDWIFPKDSAGLQKKALDSLKEVVRKILTGVPENDIEKWFREEMKSFIK